LADHPPARLATTALRCALLGARPRSLWPAEVLGLRRLWCVASEPATRAPAGSRLRRSPFLVRRQRMLNRRGLGTGTRGRLRAMASRCNAASAELTGRSLLSRANSGCPNRSNRVGRCGHAPPDDISQPGFSALAERANWALPAGGTVLALPRRRSMASAANLSNAREASIFTCLSFGSLAPAASRLNSLARSLR
jgi:hypothetical protein